MNLWITYPVRMLVQRGALSKVIQHTSNFTILKDENDYKREFRRVLRQYSTANLASEAAIRWIASDMYNIIDKDSHTNCGCKKVEQEPTTADEYNEEWLSEPKSNNKVS